MNVAHQKSKTKHEATKERAVERERRVIQEQRKDLEFYKEIFDPLISEDSGYEPPSKKNEFYFW